ncbi:helix-turn-helix domain-containing protein [Dyadobacter sp. BHUBP1]|uniref:helix-turn-helix domain-containing protein n=1 Tax=Dyadobacter sp. BHUBP1 TaxID=3424178 RepID=UPI003D334F9F
MAAISNPFEEILEQFRNILREERDILREEVVRASTASNVTEEPEYLSLAEAARFLKLKESYVYHLKSTIPFYKPKTKVYFKKSDLIAYMESHKREPNSKLNTSSSTHEFFARPPRIRFTRSANKIKK